AGRLLPFALAAAAYGRFSGRGVRGLGLTRDGWGRDVIMGTALGVPAAGIAIAFRRWVAPGYRLPTPADQAVQTAFYLGLDGAGRGALGGRAVQDPGVRGAAPPPSPPPLRPWAWLGGDDRRLWCLSPPGELELALDRRRDSRGGGPRRSLSR